MKATVPSMSWNSPWPVVWLARRAAAPKSAIRILWPVESSSILPPAGRMQHERETGRERERERETFQVPVNDAVFMEVDDAIDDLAGVVTDNAL